MVVSVEAKIDLHTCLVPLITDSSGDRPLARSRYIFSSTTILLSSNMPTANVIPINVIELIVTSIA